MFKSVLASGCRNDPVPRAPGEKMITTRSAAALAAAACLVVLAAGQMAQVRATQPLR